MSDQDIVQDKDFHFASVLGQMIHGTAIAVAIFAAPIVFMVVIYLIGTLLPPESKEADDPTPDSFSQLILEAPLSRLG